MSEGATLTVSGRVRYHDTGADSNGQQYAEITKAGDGTLLFTNSATTVHKNTTYTITGGTLKFTNVNAFQDGTNAIAITVTNGKLQFEGKSGTPIRNNISIAATQNVEFKPTGGTVEYSGSLTGTGTFTNTSGEWQQLILSGNNSTFQGTIKNFTPNIPATETTPAVAGTNGLMFFNGVNSALPQGKFAGGGTVCFLPADADNSVFQFGELSGGGTLRPSTSTAANFTLEVGGLNSNSTFSGYLTDYINDEQGNYSKSLALKKVGTGTLTLTNSGNNYRGGTVVSAGTLETKALGRGAVSVEGGTFKYNGGTTTFASNIAVAEGGTFQLDKSGTTLTATGTLTGAGKIDVQNGTLSYTGTSTTLAQDINIGANGKFQYNHASTLSGDLTGSGVIQNSGGWSYYTGNNSAFEGTFQLNDLAFFQNGESSSGKATYQGGGPIILKVTDAAKNTYEFGKVTGSILIRPSNTSMSDHYVKIGGTNEDFIYSGVVCDYVDKTTGLIKTGTGTLTLTADFSKAATITNDSNAKPYSLGTTVEDGRLVIASGAVIGTGAGDRLVVNAVSETVHPAITLSCTINGDLQIDGLLTLDFTDANDPVGIVTGNVLFGDSAGLQAISGDAGWNAGMTYTLKSANSDDTLAAMTRLLSEAIEAGTLSDIFNVMPTEGGVIIAVDGNKIPEPATWVLMVLGLTGAVCVALRRRRGR